MNQNVLNKLRSIWTSEDSFATTLITLFIDQYTTEALEWSPLTITLELHDDLGVQLPPASRDRLQAAIYHLTSDAFYTSVPTFNELCSVFSGAAWTPEVVDPASAADLAWGLTEALLLGPPDQEDENPFSEEIIAFIGQVLAEEGILQPPDILRLAGVNKELLDRVRYDYADDPTMFEAIWTAERSKTDYINNLVQTRLKALVQQLQSLPLEHGNAEKVAGRMAQQLQQMKRHKG